MEMEQEFDWNEAQKIVITVDLVAAAKQQLQFLAAVDGNRYLYGGPALERAIYRYHACWLPLLAKHSESQISEGPLVVPLDCEWVWHCHRLNPVRYKADCEELYGRILDNSNVVSSVQGTCQRQTEEIWNRMNPEEPYNFNLDRALSENMSERISGLEKYTTYDLVSAIKRQSPFFYQVSRPHVNNDLFLEGAVARYKGFLHLIKRNREKSMKRFCVPTYDVDLIWHTHQLHPVSYCKDLGEVLGKVLEHDDMDSDRGKGKKLDVGFSGTTKQWEETFGTRYWRAGAMYRGNAPSPLTATPCLSDMIGKDKVPSKKFQKIIQLPQLKVVEVLLEFVGVRNLPEGHKGSLFVSFCKRQPDAIFNAKRNLSILSESGEKQVASFQCEPMGELLFELISQSTSNFPIKKAPKVLGSTSISLQDFLDPVSKLSVEKWLELVPSSSTVMSKPICLRVAVSFTVPSPAPHVLHMIDSQPHPKVSCFFPLPGKVQHARSLVHVIDENDTQVLSLQMRDSKKDKAIENCTPRKEVVAIMSSGETQTLAQFAGTGWSLMDSHWSLHSQKQSSDDGPLFELMGNRMVKFYPGRKLEYEPKHCDKCRSEQDFMTAVEFSREDPYGKGAFAIIEDRAKALLLSTLLTFSETIGSQRKCEAAMGSSLTALLLFSLFLSLVISRADMETTTLKGVDLESPAIVVTPYPLSGHSASQSSKDVLLCERVKVSGLSRLKLGSYASSFRATLSPSVEIPERLHSKIQVCFHRNNSLGLCQCENDDWKSFKGLWSSVMSPYEDRYIDVKFISEASGSVTVAVEEDLQKWRFVCLALGFILLLAAPVVSSWVPFYYSSSMVIGVFLVIIILLFQGMKLLPTGRKNLFYLTLYGSVLGAGSFLVHQFSMFVNSILVNFGLNEEMRNPVSIFVLVVIILAGAALGYWIVRKFVISEDGSVDVGIAQFVKWAMRIIGATSILQSTLDTPLALVALISCWAICNLVFSLRWLGALHQSYMRNENAWLKQERKTTGKHSRAEFLSRSSLQGKMWTSPKKPSAWSNSPVGGVISPSFGTKNQQEYYSTFHNMRNRKKFTREEWDDFTRESTLQAMAEWAASPEFSDWMIENADRIQLLPSESSDQVMGSESDSTDDNVKGSPRRFGFINW